MPLGPGKYDDECTYVRDQTGASAAIVIVIGGDRGNGFACQSDLDVLAKLPDLLEQMAAEIRKSRGF